MATIQLLIVVLLLFANSVNLKASPGNFDRIINGVSQSIYDRPFQVLVLPVYCGGSIIAPLWVVTAAHCTIKQTASTLSFAVGVQFTYEHDDVYQVDQLIEHEQYNSTGPTQDNDIALLKSSTTITYTLKVHSIRLMKYLPYDGETVVVSGYGYTEENGELNDELLSTDLELVEYKKCKDIYQYYLTTNMICADGGNDLKDSCQGDSGGPLTYNGDLLGIVSFGSGCGQPGYPGVYTNVPNYVNWIRKITGIFNL